MICVGIASIHATQSGFKFTTANVIYRLMSKTKNFYPDSSFGDWFIQSNIWAKYVLRRSIKDLRVIYSSFKTTSSPVVLDVGCGYGSSFRYLIRFFKPKRIYAIDLDPSAILIAKERASWLGTPIEVLLGDCSNLPYESSSMDLIFCHQTLHHLTDQTSALQEFRRVLKKDGILVLAESTKVFIESLAIDILFKHPPESQRYSYEYLELIEKSGFEISAKSLQYPDFWWTKLHFRNLFPKKKNGRNGLEPLVYLIANVNKT